MFDPDDLPPPPALSAEAYGRLQKTLAEKGPVAAAEQLCADLREQGDLSALFYALLMKKRVELGVTPFPTGAAAELPPATHAEYEQAIRDAGRLVGSEFLKQHDGMPGTLPMLGAGHHTESGRPSPFLVMPKAS